MFVDLRIATKDNPLNMHPCEVNKCMQHVTRTTRYGECVIYFSLDVE